MASVSAYYEHVQKRALILRASLWFTATGRKFNAEG